MNKPRTIEGRWWIHGDDKPPHFGVLNFDPEKGLELTVKIAEAKATWDVLRSLSAGRVEAPTVIHGEDEHSRRITLFGCINQGRSIASGLATYRVGSLVGILNYNGNSWAEAKFRAVKVHYSLLHAWIGKRPVENVTSEDGRPAVAVTCHPPLLVDIAPGIRLRVEGSFTSKDSLSEHHYDFDSRVWFHFAEPCSLETIRAEYASRLLPLLCLLTGERIFKDELVLYEHDPFEPGHPRPSIACELLQRNPDINEAERGRHGAHMRVPFQEIEPEFARVFTRWFQCYVTLKPVVDLYFIVTSNLAPTFESRFLFSAQALEVYHARSQHFAQSELTREAHKARFSAILESAPDEHRGWLKDKLAFANQKTLAQRLDDLLGHHSEEAAQITAHIPDFAAKVRYARNYFTHYSPDLLDRGKVPEGGDLSRLTLAVEALLEICLLKELGISGAPITRALERFTDMKVIELESSQPHPPSLTAGENSAQGPSPDTVQA